MMPRKSDVMDIAARLKAEGEEFVIATVVRTVSVTAAKAGAKAVIRADGTISGGWIGGGCARAAVLRAAKEAFADGKPRLISVQPENLLIERGVKPGESREGIKFAKNMCPSKGTMDIFVEPVLARPVLAIFGSSPVAIALATLGQTLGYSVTACTSADEQSAFSEVDVRVEGFSLPAKIRGQRYVVVSTQGKGDEAALKAAMSVEAEYRAFVGSRRKMEAVRASLIAGNCDPILIDKVKAPAGLDLGAITPEEIALSILAEITLEYRRGHRGDAPTAS